MSVRTSWELGTLAQALTEIEYPEYSVFSPSTAFPITFRDPLPEDVIIIAKEYAVTPGLPYGSSNRPPGLFRRNLLIVLPS